MPSVGNLWAINTNPHQESHVANSAPSTSKPAQSTQLLILVVTASSITLIVVGITVWRILLVRHRKVKCAKTRNVVNMERETEVEAKDSEELDTAIDEGDVKPMDKLGSDLDVTSKPNPLEDESIPVIVITRSEVDLSKTATSLPNSDQSEDYMRKVRRISSSSDPSYDADFEDTDTSISNASLFSEDILEEMSTIATHLRRVGSEKSIDIEVKSVESEKSSVVVSPERPSQPEPHSAENINIRDCMDQAIETLEGLLLSLEIMEQSDEEPAYSGSFPFTSVESTSLSPFFTTSVQMLSTIVEDDSEESDNIVHLDASEGQTPPGTPLTAVTSLNTTLNDDDTLAGLTPEKKDALSTPLGALLSVLGMPLGSVESTSSSETLPVVSPPLSPVSPLATRSVISDTPNFLPFTELQVPSTGETETEVIQPAQVRSPLGNIKTAELSNGVPQPPRATRQGRARTSSRDKSENRATRKAHEVLRSRPLRPGVVPRADLHFVR